RTRSSLNHAALRVGANARPAGVQVIEARHAATARRGLLRAGPARRRGSRVRKSPGRHRSEEEADQDHGGVLDCGVAVVLRHEDDVARYRTRQEAARGRQAIVDRQEQIEGEPERDLREEFQREYGRPRVSDEPTTDLRIGGGLNEPGTEVE